MKLKHIIIITVLIFLVGLTVILLGGSSDEINLNLDQNNDEIVGGIVEKDDEDASLDKGEVDQEKEDEKEDEDLTTELWTSVVPKNNSTLPFDVLSVEGGNLKVRIFDSSDMETVAGAVNGIIGDIEKLNRGVVLNNEVSVVLDGNQEILYDYKANKIRRP